MLQKFIKIRLLLIILTLFPIVTFGSDLSIGAAKVNITPPPEVPISGYYHKRISTRIHDELFARTFVVECNEQKIAVVTCDLIEIPASLANDVRRLAETRTGIPFSHIMVSATHTHTAPVIPFPGNINNLSDESAGMLAPYLNKLPQLIAESIVQADAGLKPAILYYGDVEDYSISINRRYFMKDGSVGWSLRPSNPGIIGPAGPIDPTVSVLYAESLDRKPIFTYVNFAVHLDIIGFEEISADMPHYLSEILGKVKGSDMVTIFSQGCSGNVDHNPHGQDPKTGPVVAEQIGYMMAGAVMKTFALMKPAEVGDICVKREFVQLPLAPISADEVPEAIKISGSYGQVEKYPFLDLVQAFKVKVVHDRDGKQFDAEIQAIAFGKDIVLLSLPGEIFVELGMYIKSRSLFENTIVVELTNDQLDYFPDSKAFAEGNYEPISSRCAPGSGEILAGEAIKILNGLKTVLK